jgi:hypothetical protein
LILQLRGYGRRRKRGLRPNDADDNERQKQSVKIFNQNIRSTIHLCSPPVFSQTKNVFRLNTEKFTAPGLRKT